MPSKCDMCAMLVAAAGVACMVVFDPANPGRTVKNTLLQAHQLHQTYIASAGAPRQLSELASQATIAGHCCYQCCRFRWHCC